MDNIKQTIAELDAADFAHLTSWITTTERSRRNTLAAVHRREDEIAAGYHEAQGTLNTDDETNAPEWVQPVGAHDAWPVGALVSHAGHTWRNTAGVVNVWEPGSDGPVPTWTRIDYDEEDAPQPFVKPTGSHDAYSLGARVLFNGKVYRSLIDANIYSPDEYPSGWELEDLD